jgi:hypothetical protein
MTFVRVSPPPARNRRRPLARAPLHRNEPGAPITITGVTAAVNVTAGTAGSVSLGAASVFILGTAAAMVAVQAGDAGDVALVDTNIIIVGDDTPVISVTSQSSPVLLTGGVGVPGDYFASPIQVTGLTGSVSTSPGSAGVESWEVDVTTSVWVLYRAPVAGEVQLQTSGLAAGGMVAVCEGFTPDDLVVSDESFTYPLDGLTTYVSAGRDYYWRISTGVGAASVTLSWSLAPGAADLSVSVQQQLLEHSPAVLPVIVTGAQPGETLTVTIEGTSSAYTNVTGLGLGVAHTFLADDSGTATISVPVPAVSAGTYIAQVVTSSGTATASFQILNSASTAPTAGGADSTPTPPSQAGVVRWVFQDPAPGGLGTYVVPINPSQMSAPHSPRSVTWDHTAAFSGPALGWESAYRATEWKFSGTILTQAHRQKMDAFAALNRRFWIMDHFGRHWLVVVEQFAPVELNDVTQPWACTYDCTALILAEGGS